MAQFARPSVDTLRDNWEQDDAGTVDIYDHIDETVADNADYIRTQLTPTSDVFVTKLTTLEDPLVSTGHIVRYRYGKNTSSGDQIDIIVQLRQGYVNEGTPGTLIASATHTDVPSGFTDGTITLSSGEADSITVYTDLYLRFVGNKV